MKSLRGSHIDKATRWGRRLEAIASFLGIKGWLTAIAGTALAVSWAFLVRVTTRVPWWGTVVLALLLSVLLLRLFVELRRAWAIRGVKSLDVVEVGRECVKLHQEIFDWLANRAESSPRRAEVQFTSDSPSHRKAIDDHFAATVRHSEQTRIRLAQKFLPRILSLCHLLETLGIAPPSLWAFDHNALPASSYIGSIGELLTAGLLEEARAMRPEQFRNLPHLIT